MQAQSPQESAVDGGDTATTGVAKGRIVVIVLTAVAALVLVLVAMLYWRYQQHVEVEELEAVIAIGQQLTERTCVDVIGDWESSGICHPEALAYDEDGNGTYELCPAYAE